MYIDMGERIAIKEDRPNLIIKDPLRAPKIDQNMVNEVKHDHKWVNLGKKSFSQDYLINTFIEIW